MLEQQRILSEQVAVQNVLIQQQQGGGGGMMQQQVQPQYAQAIVIQQPQYVQTAQPVPVYASAVAASSVVVGGHSNIYPVSSAPPQPSSIVKANY